MRIAIPTNDKQGLEGSTAEHFGRCRTYTIIDEQGAILEIIDNTSQHMEGQKMPPQLLKDNHVDMMICRELGPKAIDLCSSLGISIAIT